MNRTVLLVAGLFLALPVYAHKAHVHGEGQLEASIDKDTITLSLERQGDKVTEFFIVPYFGACIHTPPPPANQIIHARSSRPLSGIESMMPIWSYGTFSVQRGETAWGVAGYRMNVHKIARYEDQQPKTE